MSPDQFGDRLCELDVSRQDLRADPAGATWLPKGLQEVTERDPACRAALREHVELELALFEEGSGRSDALFTARVMRALPDVDRQDASRRNFILAAAHALAIGAGYLVLWPLYEAGYFQPWVNDAQSMLDNGTASMGAEGLVGLAVIACLAAMLALLPRLRSGQLRPEG
jgi:anti-sigma factor RsiW